MAVKTESPKAEPKARAACLCGCGDTPSGKTARFVQGHDARLHGRLIEQARNGSDARIRKAALAQIAKFGWRAPAEPRKRVSKAQPKVDLNVPIEQVVGSLAALVGGKA